MSSKNNIPAIRFRGFSGEWKYREMQDNLVTIQTGTNLLGAIQNAGTPLLKMGNIQRGYFVLEKLEYININVEVEKENIVYYGDFFFNTRNTLELVGKGATWMGDNGKFAFNSNLARFTFKGINTIFFNYLYNTRRFIEQISGRAMGTTSVAAIYPRSLGSVNYMLPSIDEQQQIGNYFKNIDHLITQSTKRLEKLKNLKKAYLEKMFPRGGATTPELRFKGFSEEWVEKSLMEICSYKSSSVSAGNANVKGKYPLYDANCRIGYTDSDFVNSEYISIIKDGSGVGRTRVLEANSFFIGTMGAIIANENTNLYFIWNTILNFDFNEFITGATIPHIYFSDYGVKTIFVPAIEEQTKIGNFFRNIDEQIAKQTEKLDKLKNIKKACLDKMFV